MSVWTLYADQQPPEGKALYWWRIPHRDYGNLTLRPEWVAPFIHHGAHGGTWTAACAHWDGYSLILPEGLEWRACGHDDKKDMVSWPDLHLLPCPFCGSDAKVKVNTQYICAPIYHYKTFDLGCSGCGLPESRFNPNLKKMVDRWNTRHSHLRSVA